VAMCLGAISSVLERYAACSTSRKAQLCNEQNYREESGLFIKSSLWWALVVQPT
jgi:hypothetical protein